MTQAKSEGFKGRRLKMRIAELVEQKRDEAMNQEAHERASRITFNYEPKGVFSRGAYNALIKLQKELPPTRFFVPFARIVTNITQNYINYTPVGIITGAIGKTKDGSGIRNMT